MNLKLLDAFAAIMLTGSTTAAAERLALSQSAVSRLLAQLEEDLGLRLFVREKGRLAPTREAQALLPDAQRLLDSAQAFRRHAEQLRLGGFTRRLLKVSVPGTLAMSLMPGLVARFMRERPDAVVEVLTGTYVDTERALAAREADLGLVRLPLQLPGLRVLAQLESDLVCLMPAGHPLEGLAEVAPLDLSDQSLVLLGRQRQLRHDIDQVFRQARVLPRVAAEVHSVGMACRFVAEGLGVSVVNALIAGLVGDTPGLSVRPFRPRISYRMALATSEECAVLPLCEAFCASLVDALGQRIGPHGHVRFIAPASA